MTKTNTFRRKKKLINGPLQLKLIGAFLSVSFIAALFQVVLLNRALMKLSEKLPIEGNTLLGFLPSVMTSNLLMTLGILCPLTFLVGLLVTHRVAGPAYRMEQHLKQIARGERPGPCRIRKDDELWTLCHAINSAVEGLLQETSRHSSMIDVDQVPGLCDHPRPTAEMLARMEVRARAEAEASASLSVEEV